MEAGSYHHVSLRQGVQQSIEIRGVVLAVGVDLDKSGVAASLCVEERRTHGATDSHIERKCDDGSAQLSGSLGCEVRGAVIDHEDISLGPVLLHLGNDVLDRLFLVPRGDSDQLT